MAALYIVIAILLFGVLILVHEFGHFICAKLFGVQVNEFSLFMGPALFKRTRGETTYSLRCIPIGGYCAMEGEDGESDNPRAFGNAKVWKRLIILVAGSLMNFVAGFIMTVIYVSLAYPYVPTTELTGITESSLIESGENGLQPGDQLYSIDGERVYINADITLLLSRNDTGVYDIVVVRDGDKVTLEDFEMHTYEEDGVQRYGMNFDVKDKSVGNLLGFSFSYCRDFARLVRMGLQDMITGRAKLRDMGGPVLIIETVVQAGVESDTVGIGMINVLYFFAFIAINLGVMNLLPIPALDGGRAVCLLLTTAIEKIIRRKINPKYEGYLHGVFMLLLLAFMALITFKDIFNLFR